MKYEFLIRAKEHPYSNFRDLWKGIVDESRYDEVKKKFESKFEQIVSLGEFYDVWLLINRLTDDGDFIEVVQ